jgi:hypothetical protein
VSDTPVQQGPNYGCPTFPHPSCGNTSDMFMNYMDYTDDACMNLFTQAQKTRMRAVLAPNGFRAGLLNSLGCSPPGGGCSGTQTLTAASGTFSDGSGSNNYQDNSDCRWLIQPLNATSITLTFQSFNLLSGDFVYVYDGNTTSAPLLGTFSGNTLPAPVTSSGGVMLVRFVSDGSGTADGFVASYTSTLNVPCYGTQTVSGASGTITDGSGNSDYTNRANCRWLIQPPNATRIELTFSSFNTESNYDFVKVYDGATTSAPLLGSYSGTTLPPVLRSSGGSLLIVFTSDNSITRAGWSASYTSSIYLPPCPQRQPPPKCGSIPSLALTTSRLKCLLALRAKCWMLQEGSSGKA